MMKRLAAALLAALLMVTGVGFAEDTTAEQLSGMKLEMLTLKAKITALKAEIASRDTKITTLQAEVDAHKEQLVALQTQITSQTEQLDALTAEVEALKALLDEPEDTLVGEVDPSLCGKWYLKTIKMEELTFDPMSMGAEASLILNADGTGSLNMSGEEPQEFTWAAKDDEVMLLSDGEADTLTLEDGTLTAEEDGFGIVFVRDADKVTSTKVKRAAALSDFSGKWLATRGSLAGMEMSLEDADYEISLTVEGRYATLSKKEDGKVNQRSGYGMLLGGTLTVFGSVGQEDLELQMLEDGRIMLEVEMTDDLLITYYFEKVK